MADAPNRGPWIIAGAILLAAALIVGYFIYQNRQDQKCAEWQAQVEEIADAGNLSFSQVASIVEEDSDFERPSGCPNP